MKVKLLQATPNAGEMVADIASICYGKLEASCPDRLLRHLFDNGHHSTFEHIYFTFRVKELSRVALAQLTRHRHASFTVRSSRYCNESQTKYIYPESMRREDVRGSIGAMQFLYDELINSGVNKEDARFILPQALSTDLYMSCNLRELIHIAELRTSKQAQWEIRDLLNKMTILVVENSPELAFMFKEAR